MLILLIVPCMVPSDKPAEEALSTSQCTVLAAVQQMVEVSRKKKDNSASLDNSIITYSSG